MLVDWQGNRLNPFILQSNRDFIVYFFFSREMIIAQIIKDHKKKNKQTKFCFAGSRLPTSLFVVALQDKYHQKTQNIREKTGQKEKRSEGGARGEIDVISCAALNQYLITGMKERLLCVCMC